MKIEHFYLQESNNLKTILIFATTSAGERMGKPKNGETKGYWRVENNDRLELWIMLMEALQLGWDLEEAKKFCQERELDFADSVQMLWHHPIPTEQQQEGMNIFIEKILEIDKRDYWHTVLQIRSEQDLHMSEIFGMITSIRMDDEPIAPKLAGCSAVDYMIDLSEISSKYEDSPYYGAENIGYELVKESMELLKKENLINGSVENFIKNPMKKFDRKQLKEIRAVLQVWLVTKIAEMKEVIQKNTGKAPTFVEIRTNTMLDRLKEKISTQGVTEIMKDFFDADLGDRRN